MTILNFFCAAVLASCPLLFGTLGEGLNQKSGSLNLGVEGMMFMGAVGGLAGSFYYEKATENPIAMISVLIAIAAAFLCAAFGALIYSVITITFRANQNVTGLALTILGTGLANFAGEAMATASGGYVVVGSVTKTAFNSPLFPTLETIPVIGKLLFSYNFMVYLALFFAVALSLFLHHTRRGLNLRAVGESPATADATGINVTKYKYLGSIIGGGISGLGGLYVVMSSTNGVGGVWVHNAVLGYGWLSVALVIFSTWNPSRAVICAFIFGALSVMRLYIPLGIPDQIYSIFPYIATILVLIVVSLRKRRENQPPASLGLAYFREER